MLDAPEPTPAKREATPEEAAQLDAPADAPSFGNKLLSTAGDALGSIANHVVESSNPLQQAYNLVTKPGELAGKLRAAQNGISWGTAPRIAAALKSGVGSVAHGIMPDTFEAGPTYEEALSEQLPLYAKASADYPAEDIAASFATGGPEVRGGGFLARGLKMGLGGGAQTAARIAGRSKDGLGALDSGSAPEMALGVALPAVLGAATGPFSRTADDMALRATGLKGGISNKLQNMGYETADDAAQLGHEIRKADLVPWFGDSHDVANRATQLEQTSGQQIGRAIEAADASGVKPDFQAPVVAARKGLMRESPVLRQAGGKLRDFLDTLEKTPSQLVDDNGLPREATFRDLNTGKSDAWKSANMSTEAQGAAPLYRQGVGRVRDDIQRQVEAAAGRDVADSLASGNKDYGLSRDVKRIANDVNTRDAHKLGLPDLVSAGIGGLLGGASLGHGAAAGSLGSIGGVMATQLSKRYGPAFLTRAAQMAEPLEGAVNQTPAAGSIADYLRLLSEEKDQP